MSSGYPGEFIRGGGGCGGAVRPPTIGGNQTYGFRQQQQQQQQQGGMMMLQDQIDQRRADLLMGKRSFGDYQSYQQLLSLQQQMQQQQQQQPVSYLQLQQQLQQQQQQQQQQQRQQQQSTQQHMSMLLRNQSLMRSVKQRTSPVDLSSLTNNNNNNNINMLNHNNNNNSNNSLTRFGVPVYQQPRQQQIPFINNNQLNQTSSYTQLNPYNNININNQIIPTTFPISSNNNYSQVINPVQTGVFVPPVQPDIEDQKIFNTLQELEKQLLDDDDDNDNDEYSVANTLENDAVSGVTNSEWSETFQSLMSPNPSPSPSPLPANNNVVSPSPTSSTSSCCSTSAPATTVSPKQLIADVAAAISDGKNDLAAEMLAKLSLVSNCDGSSEQRLAYYMSHALRCRVDNVHAAPVAELFGGDQVSSVYSLYDISPCFKFGLLAANLVMLEAITGAIHEGLKIHIIDFDVGHGAQYVNLLRALAERRTRVPCLGMKITIVETALGAGGEGGVETGGVKDALVGLADRLGVSLKYECVTRAIQELTRESLGCEEGEAVVVNFAFKLYRVPDESVSVDNLRDELLRRVKGLSPRAVTLVEQDMNGNGAPFMTRVSEVCEYYGALFDSLEATLGRDNVDRCRVEKGLGRKMVNSVACEGKERVERAEVFGKWRARMGMAGFQLKALSHTVAESMRAKLDLARGGNPGFTVKEENGGVGFGWMGRNLTVASAWR